MTKRQVFKYSVRNKLLEKKIRGLDRSEIIGVAIDIGKEFYKVLIFDFNGKIIFKPFAIDVFKTGYERLIKNIHIAKEKRKAKKVFIGLEPSGCYGYQLTRCLRRDFGDVFFINTLATASNRDQKMLLGLKTDDIDLCSIGDLLVRGECYQYNLQEGIYLTLQEDTYWRENKLKMIVTLKNQISKRVDKIFPGLDSKFNKNKPLFSNHFLSNKYWAVVDLLLGWKRFKKLNSERMIEFFKERDCVLGKDKAKIFRRYFDNLLLDESVIAKDLEFISRDIKLLKLVEQEIEEIESEMVSLMQMTPVKYVSGQIKGISDMNLASYIGALGDINQYDDAGKIFSKAGLCPRIKQSGNYSGKGLGIKKTGNRFLRTILFKMASFVIFHEPYFAQYYTHLREDKKKPWAKAVIAVARKLNRVMFAMIKRETTFNPPIRNFGMAQKPKELVLTDEASPVPK